MDRLLPSVIVAIVIIAGVAGMFLGWRARQRRQSGIPHPLGVPETPGRVLASATGLYVATTRAGDPLERIAVHGLGFRARTVASVTGGGVILELTGQDAVFIPSAHVRRAATASFVIDKAVESGGLVVLGWRLGEFDVESYLRLEGDPVGFLDAVNSIATSDGREVEA